MFTAYSVDSMLEHALRSLQCLGARADLCVLSPVSQWLSALAVTLSTVSADEFLLPLVDTRICRRMGRLPTHSAAQNLFSIAFCVE